MEDVHPKLYPVPYLPPSLHPPNIYTHMHTHTHTNYDQDFKVIVLSFYLIDKREFRQAVLSGDRSFLHNAFYRTETTIEIS